MELTTRQASELHSDQGFTLIEMLISLLIGTILVSAIYAAFQAQQRVLLVQNGVVETQQNARAIIETVTRDVQMAGYDPELSGLFGITKAGLTELTITKDTTGDGSLTSGEKETVAYTFDAESNGEASDSDGDSFYRDNDDDNGSLAVADNIQAIEFIYLDENENETSILSNIRSVQISILARTSREDYRFTNNETYTSAGDKTWGPYGDHYRRRLITALVHCRNMGL